GCIVHISSTRAFMSEPNNEPHSASKAGLLGLSQAMAVSLAPQGVRVNAILPGWIHVVGECREGDEGGWEWERGLAEEDHAWHLTGRVGRVEDVLDAVEFLGGAEGVSYEEDGSSRGVG
ncbi:NAD(P)-binding protein, partial [Teratosphaeria nubilosa]